MSQVKPWDIFRRLQISAGFRIHKQDNCMLCGLTDYDDEIRIICSSCVQCLTNLSIKDKQKIYKHLHELGDKKRAKTFSRYFQVFKTDSPLKKNRKSLKLTQKELAKKLGIKRSLIAQIEVGIRPCNQHIEREIKKMLQRYGNAT